MLKKIRDDIAKSYADVYKYPHMMVLIKYSFKAMMLMTVLTSIAVLIFTLVKGMRPSASIGQYMILIILAIMIVLYKKNVNPLKLVIIYLVFYFSITIIASCILSYFHPMIPLLILFLLVMTILLLQRSLRIIVLSYFLAGNILMIVFSIRKVLTDDILSNDMFIGKLIGIAIVTVMMITSVWLFNRKFMDMNAQLYKHSMKDALTGTYNIRRLKEVMKINIENYKTIKSNFSVVLFDLDNFKIVNDALGHDIGDKLLKDFSELVSKHIRENDTFIRYGGDEFVLLLPGCEKDACEKICSRILADFRMLKDEYNNISISFSAGISDYKEAFDMNVDIMKIADKRMYISKDKGRNLITTAG